VPLSGGYLMLRVIEEFPDYSVNEYGEVYSYKSDKWLSRRIYEGGYWGVSLRDDDGKNIYRNCHTLTAKAFLKDSYEEGLIVNHKDLDKSNCHYTNLEWVTPKENSDHYVFNMPAHASSHRRSLPVEDIHRVCSLVEEGHTTQKIYELTGVTKNQISKLRTGALYSWVSKDYKLQPEPKIGITKDVVVEICEHLESGLGCKKVCDLYSDNEFVTKKSVNNIKYRNSYEAISNNYTWWVGKYISKSERKKARPSTTSRKA